jgi:hypothetical protein
MACLLKAGIVKPAEQPLLVNGSVNTPVTRRWLSNCHVIAATDAHATIEELLKAMFSARSMLRLYIRGASLQE